VTGLLFGIIFGNLIGRKHPKNEKIILSWIHEQ
jgi:hypothetical protein